MNRKQNETVLLRVATWIRSLPAMGRHAPYWTNGVFANDCADAADVIGERLAALTPSPTPTAPREADALREALKTARDHIEMDALEISHPTDAALIRAALAQHQPQQGEQHE